MVKNIYVLIISSSIFILGESLCKISILDVPTFIIFLKEGYESEMSGKRKRESQTTIPEVHEEKKLKNDQTVHEEKKPPQSSNDHNAKHPYVKKLI